MAQDLELGRGQADPSLAALDASARQVDDQILVADDPAAGRVGEVPVRSPQQRLDPAHQLAQTERLGQVVVGAHLESDDLVDLVITRRQDQDGHLRPGRTHASQDLEAVYPGQPDIEDHEIGGLARGDLEALFAGPGDAHVIALLLEGVLDPASDGVFVFDDQDGCSHGGMLHRLAILAPEGCSGGASTRGAASPRGTLWGRFRAPRHLRPRR